jgi:uncharacterized protein YqgC (DUF456 family)
MVAAVIAFILGLFIVIPRYWVYLPFLAVLPLVFFMVKTKDFKRSGTYSWLLCVALLYWNWGFLGGGSVKMPARGKAAKKAS